MATEFIVRIVDEGQDRQIVYLMPTSSVTRLPWVHPVWRYASLEQTEQTIEDGTPKTILLLAQRGPGEQVNVKELSSNQDVVAFLRRIGRFLRDGER